MKIKLFLMAACSPVLLFSQKVFTQDVGNFWNAYDKIVAEKDSLKQIDLLKTLYIDKGTPGLEGIMKARRYTTEEYISAIRHYPKFWNSVRANTLKAPVFSTGIQNGIKKFEKIYPEARPAEVYFTVGALRTGGTIIGDKVLIGSELALTDKNTISTELDKKFPYLSSFFKTDPIKNVVFLNVHEYIHIQQKSTIGNILLAQTIIEGAAEFVATLALNTKSPNPQIEFGLKNEGKIKQEYVKDIFLSYMGNWFYNNADNPFGMRDLGYFVGYAICKKYYDVAKDKKKAIKELIELDYNNEAVLTDFVNHTKYFEQPLSFYKEEYEKKRPTVVNIQEIGNNTTNVNPDTKKLTIVFSAPMNPNFRNFDFGPLGKENLMRIEKVLGYSEDKKTLRLQIEKLLPGNQYQIIVGEGFRSVDNLPLKSYLIDFKTALK